jgi:hypothetical protein
MPIYKQAKEGGVFSSSSIALLGRVFDKLKHQCPERREHWLLAFWPITRPASGMKTSCLWRRSYPSGASSERCTDGFSLSGC